MWSCATYFLADPPDTTEEGVTFLHPSCEILNFKEKMFCKLNT